MTYEKAQFLSWEIHTGPDIAGGSWSYRGIGAAAPGDRRMEIYNQILDIECRVFYISQAIQAATPLADPNSNCLKIFIAPEFLCRGAAGAYVQDLMTGWNALPTDWQSDARLGGNWAGLILRLRQIVRANAFDDWLFVFGSTLGCAFKTQSAITPAGQVALIEDLAQSCEGYNVAPVIRGGAHHNTDSHIHIGRKHLQSGIDYVNALVAAAGIHTNVSVNMLDKSAMGNFEAANDVLRPAGDVLAEGSCLFQLADTQVAAHTGAAARNIVFGLEVCLDHSHSVTAAGVVNNGRLLNAVNAGQPRVDIQLVPSGGMQIHPASIALSPGGHIVNCDGLNGAGVRGAHTEIASQAAGLAVHRGDNGQPGNIPLHGVGVQAIADPGYAASDGNNYNAGDLWAAPPGVAGWNTLGYIRSTDSNYALY